MKALVDKDETIDILSLKELEIIDKDKYFNLHHNNQDLKKLIYEFLT